MKHLLFFTFVFVPALSFLAQRSIGQVHAPFSREHHATPRDTYYNTVEKQAEPTRTYHDWKQTIAERNSAVATLACQQTQSRMPAAPTLNGNTVWPQRFQADPERMYYYSGTPYTWKRSHAMKIDSTCGIGYLKPSDFSHNGDPAFELVACMTYFNFYTPLPNVNDIHYRYYSAYAHDGYIVYKGDTIPGVVTVGYDRVTVENTDGQGHQKRHIALLDNLLLRDIVVYTELKELHMRRPHRDDKRLWRVLLHGKLNVYDKRYSFISSKNVDIRSLRMQYGNGTLHKVHSKKQLVAALNKTYQLKLKSDKYNWKELFDLIATLG